jgi:hypothetical protein
VIANNTAFVAVLKNIRPIEGADRIVRADVTLNGVTITQVVVGKDTQENTFVVYFDSNLALSDRFVFDYPELATYLAKGNRVRVVKLKGVISNGLAVEISKFDNFLNSDDRVWCVIKDKNHAGLYDPEVTKDRVKPTYLVYKVGKRAIVTNKIPQDGFYIIKREK